MSHIFDKYSITNEKMIICKQPKIGLFKIKIVLKIRSSCFYNHVIFIFINYILLLSKKNLLA